MSSSLTLVKMRIVFPLTLASPYFYYRQTSGMMAIPSSEYGFHVCFFLASEYISIQTFSFRVYKRTDF